LLPFSSVSVDLEVKTPREPHPSLVPVCVLPGGGLLGGSPRESSCSQHPVPLTAPCTDPSSLQISSTARLCRACSEAGLPFRSCVVSPCQPGSLPHQRPACSSPGECPSWCTERSLAELDSSGLPVLVLPSPYRVCVPDSGICLNAWICLQWWCRRQSPCFSTASSSPSWSPVASFQLPGLCNNFLMVSAGTIECLSQEDRTSLTDAHP